MRLQEDRAPSTVRAFEQWEDGNPARGRAYDDLVRLQSMQSLRKATLVDRDRLKSSVLPSGRPALSKRRQWKIGGAAIAAIVLVCVAWLLVPALTLQWRADYITAAGERETVLLPDGSTAFLNTSSAIGIDFADGQRRVTLLNGEAFFDVKHDPARTFIVAGDFSTVEVKGTAFGVLADGGRDTVVLERGRVEVRGTTGRSDHADLEPGQMITASTEGLSQVAVTDPTQLLAWREGRVVFHDRLFGDALSDLQRYYDGSVFVTSGRFANKRVSGNFRIDDPEMAIRTLAISAGVSVTRFPGGVLILR